MALIYMSGGYVIDVAGTRGEIANLLSSLPPENPFVEFETETDPAVPLILNANQVVAIAEQPLPSL